MFESLNFIFQQVEHYEFQTIDQILDKKSDEEKFNLVQHCQENPFAMYASYLDLVRPIHIEENNDTQKERIKLLEEQVKYLEAEAKTSTEFCNIFQIQEQ